MKITKIVQQEKQKDRYSLFVDGKYTFSLSEGALLESGLATGQELSQDEINGYKKLSADDKLYAQALRYAASRLRSSWEMEQYLRRKNADPLLSSTILNKLSNIDVLNDEAFARAWVTNRRLLRSASKRKLQQELRAKRVSDEVIEQALRDDTSDDRELLKTVVAKKRRLPKYRQDPLKLMQYLARQGFTYDDIKTVLGEPSED